MTALPSVAGLRAGTGPVEVPHGVGQRIAESQIVASLGRRGVTALLSVAGLHAGTGPVEVPHGVGWRIAKQRAIAVLGGVA